MPLDLTQDAISQIIAAIQAAQGFAIQRVNHTGTQAMTTVPPVAVVLSQIMANSNPAAYHDYTEFATPASVNAAIQSVVGAAPSALATLAQIDAQLASDESAAAALTTAVVGKFAQPTGTTAQYIRGDGSLATLPSSVSQVQTDWNATSGLGVLLNKPTIPAAQVNSDWSAATGLPQILNKPSLANVATSGRYSDLSGLPSIPTSFPVALSGDASGSGNTGSTAISLTLANVTTAGTFSGITVNAKGLVTGGTARAVNDAPARPIVTVAAAANGYQVSPTQDAFVSYTNSIGVGVQIGVVASVSGTIVLEKCATNSATASAWIEVGRMSNSVVIGLAVALSDTDTVTAQVGGFIPKGWYARLRSINNAGTPTFTTASQSELLL